jgi:hypothetical protein
LSTTATLPGTGRAVNRDGSMAATRATGPAISFAISIAASAPHRVSNQYHLCTSGVGRLCLGLKVRNLGEILDRACHRDKLGEFVAKDVHTPRKKHSADPADREHPDRAGRLGDSHPKCQGNPQHKGGGHYPCLFGEGSQINFARRIVCNLANENGDGPIRMAIPVRASEQEDE